MALAVFEGPFSAILFALVGVMYLLFKLIQTACSDSTAGKIVRGLTCRHFGNGRAEANDTAPSPRDDSDKGFRP